MCGLRIRKSPTTIAVLTTFANVSGVLARFSKSRNSLLWTQVSTFRGKRQVELQGGQRLIGEVQQRVRSTLSVLDSNTAGSQTFSTIR